MLTSISRAKERVAPAGMLSKTYTAVFTARTVMFSTSTALSFRTDTVKRTVPGILCTTSRSAEASTFSTICCVGSVAMMFTRPVAVSTGSPVSFTACTVNWRSWVSVMVSSFSRVTVSPLGTFSPEKTSPRMASVTLTSVKSTLPEFFSFSVSLTVSPGAPPFLSALRDALSFTSP